MYANLWHYAYLNLGKSVELRNYAQIIYFTISGYFYEWMRN